MERDEQVAKNLALTGRYFEHLLDHPSELESQPETLVVVLMPDNDDELADANIALARTLVGNPVDAEVEPEKTIHGTGSETNAAPGVLLQSVRT